MNCHWTVGRLRCKGCGKKFELAEWIDVPRGERNLFQFLRELLELREVLQMKSSETTVAGKKENRLSRMSSVIVLSARIRHKGKSTEKKVRFEDMLNIVAHLFTGETSLEEQMMLDRREWHLDRGVFERTLKQLTRDLRLASKLKPMLKDSTIRIHSFTIDKLSRQVRTFQKFNELIKGKSADLFFSVKRGQTLQTAPSQRLMVVEPTEGVGASLGVPETTVTVTDLPTWTDAINFGSEKLLEFFGQMISAGRKEGQLTVRNNQPGLIPGFAVKFSAQDFMSCSTFLLAVFEEAECYEKCSDIITLQKTLKQQLHFTGQ